MTLRLWPCFSLATIGLDGFAMVLGLATIGFNGFSIVPHHWSNDGMVTTHCWSNLVFKAKLLLYPSLRKKLCCTIILMPSYHFKDREMPKRFYVLVEKK